MAVLPQQHECVLARRLAVRGLREVAPKELCQPPVLRCAVQALRAAEAGGWAGAARDGAEVGDFLAWGCGLCWPFSLPLLCAVREDFHKLSPRK